ncbi:MAG TPA: TetR/AcrR family transcriptional regulator [Terriglobales bacterium]|nr:TetR/AcrR family transcriptional regulator [Terriglobales bacterium]
MGKGRPREFDPDQALDAALEVFWRQGYEGASLSALVAATGISKASLYAAFGNKEALFRQALERYNRRQNNCLADLLAAPTARASIERLLRRRAERQTQSGHPHGCLAVNSALVGGKQSERVRQELIRRRAATERLIRERIERGQREGDVPAGLCSADLARYVTTIIQGLSVHAASGASRAELRRVVELAMRQWPAAAAPRP